MNKSFEKYCYEELTVCIWTNSNRSEAIKQMLNNLIILLLLPEQSDQWVFNDLKIYFLPKWLSSFLYYETTRVLDNV